MSILMGRDGNISILRVGTLIAILGVAVVIGGFILFQLEQASFASPLNIDLYPGAESWGENVQAENRRSLYYRVPNTSPDTVMTYYDELLAEHEGVSVLDGQRERCVRNPLEGSFPDYVEGSGNVPFEYNCVFNDAGFDGRLRYTRVRIQPGIRDNATQIDNTGMTVIEYEQYWDR